MYNETYEEYIRSILGYPSQQMVNNANFMPNNIVTINPELENYYPEIYKKTYPMVKKACSEIKSNLTQEEIEKMADNIYERLENVENRNTNSNTSNVNNKTRQENREENRNSKNNPLLRDLIKILILRELLGNSKPPIRPPISNPRPQFRPGFPINPNTPPIMPRNDFYQNLYE